MAHHSRTPGPTLAAAVKAVRSFAPARDGFAEPTADQAARWRADGLRQAEACDDPCPRGVDPRTVDARWLADRCERYHFRLERGADGGLAFVPVDGWTMTAITPLLPRWFTDACGARRAELAVMVVPTLGVTRPRAEVHHPPPPPADDGPETCVTCRSHVWDREKSATLCDVRHCPMKGARHD